MLKNNTKKEVEKINKVGVGSFYINNDIGDCDILIIRDENGEIKMLNAHCFNVITTTKEGIEAFLNKNKYYEVEAEIVRTK